MLDVVFALVVARACARGRVVVLLLRYPPPPRGKEGVSDIFGRFGALDQVDLGSIQSNAPSRCRVRSLHGSDCMQSLIPSQQVHCL